MRFEVKALRAGEALTVVSIDATDAQDAGRQAAGQGYSVISVKTGRAWARWAVLRKPAFPLVLFSQELLALLQAGLALVESIETLAEKEQRPAVRRALDQIVGCLYEGHPLSYGLEKCGAGFPPLYIASVRASEKTGALPEALERYIAYQSQMDGVRRHVVSASIYPAMLAGVGCLVTLFLLVYVVPRFSRVYADIGGNLPLMSRLLIQWGKFLEMHAVALSLSLALGLGSMAYIVTRPASRQWMVRRIWQLPAIGTRLHLYYLARFYRSMGMLLRGGMPVVAALHMVSDLLQTTARAQLALAAASIREGQPISLSMQRHGLTTPIALRMLRVGEHTGKMGDMMERIASFYEEETARWVERFTKLFEPLLMIFIGLLIGFIVVLMYLPIFELAGSIQ